MNHNWWESLAEARRGVGGERAGGSSSETEAGSARERRQEERERSAGSEERWRNKRVEAAMS